MDPSFYYLGGVSNRGKGLMISRATFGDHIITSSAPCLGGWCNIGRPLCWLAHEVSMGGREGVKDLNCDRSLLNSMFVKKIGD